MGIRLASPPTVQYSPPIAATQSASDGDNENGEIEAQSAPPVYAAIQPTVCQGTLWEEAAVSESVGGCIADQAWVMKTENGDSICADGDVHGAGANRSILDYFMAVFPKDQLFRMTRLTSKKTHGVSAQSCNCRRAFAVFSEFDSCDKV